jgi:hypothetical protein
LKVEEYPLSPQRAGVLEMNNGNVRSRVALPQLPDCCCSLRSSSGTTW